MTKEIKVPDKVRKQVELLLAQKAVIESNISIYIQGYIDSLGLEGSWNLDTTKWTMGQIPEEKVK